MQVYRSIKRNVRSIRSFIGILDLAIRCSQFSCKSPFKISSDPLGRGRLYLLW